MRAVVITPGGSAAWLDLPAGQAARLAMLQNLVGGYIEAVATELSAWVCWVNEEGLIYHLDANPRASAVLSALGWQGGPVVGPAVFAGSDGKGGDADVTPVAVAAIEQTGGIAPPAVSRN